MIRFEYRTYCNEYKIIKVSRKAYIIKYIDYYQHICWMVKEHKFKLPTTKQYKKKAPKRQLRGFVISLNRGRTACSVADGGL